MIPPVIFRNDECIEPPVPSSVRRILFLGQVATHKGIDLLIGSMGRLAKTYPNVVLDVVGGCERHYRAELDRLIRDLGIDNQVVFWGFQQHIGRFLRTAYVYVHPTPPSRCTESFGRGAMEAAALGVPTICFRSGGLEYAVRDGESGTICNSEDSEQLARIIAMYLDDPQLRNRHSVNATAHYQSTCAPEAVGPAWIAMLQSSEWNRGPAYLTR